VFISYRREESSGWARLLQDRLAAHLGDEQVFMDVDTIRLGVDFAEVITQAVSTCEVLLAVIGPRWLTVTDQDGRRRLDDPDDLVHLEIAAALERGIRVIPILVEGAVMPRRQELPDSLATLARRNALMVRHDSFRYDVNRLVAEVERVLQPVPAEARGAKGETSAVGRQTSVQPRPARVPKVPTQPLEAVGKGEHYRAFWTRFLERVHAEHPDWTTARIPQKDNWITVPSGIKGAVYGCNFAAGSRLRAELYIDSGDARANLELFRALKKRAKPIEAVYGKALSWEELPGRRACRVADYADGDVTNTDQHDAYIDWFFDTGLRLRRALSGPTDQGPDRQLHLSASPTALEVVDTSPATAEPSSITEEVMPKLGNRYLGTVIKTTTFGAFISLTPGKDGLLHISRLGTKGQRARLVEDIVNVGDKLLVEVTEVDRKNRIFLKLAEENQ
jgi:hypothetical protein